MNVCKSKILPNDRESIRTGLQWMKRDLELAHRFRENAGFRRVLSHRSHLRGSEQTVSQKEHWHCYTNIQSCKNLQIGYEWLLRGFQRTIPLRSSTIYSYHACVAEQRVRFLLGGVRRRIIRDRFERDRF